MMIPPNSIVTSQNEIKYAVITRYLFSDDGIFFHIIAIMLFSNQ